MEAAVQQGFINNQTAYSPSDGVTYSFVNTSAAPTLTQNTVYVTTAPLPVPTPSSNTGQFENAQFNAPTFNSVYGENFMTSGTITINSALVDAGTYQSTTGVTYAASHGDSHYDGLGDCPTCAPGSTIMSYQNSFPNPQITGPQPSDISVQSNPSPVVPPPPPPTCCSGCCCTPNNVSRLNSTPKPQNRCTPILFDLSGKGFHLTNTDEGVKFDIFANGQPQLIPWTTPDSDNAWLVLDRNGNGMIDNATELFGNLTPQEASANPNGFRALAEYDKPINGGNDDGIIDQRDAIYSQLRLWIDMNHNGISEPDELITLRSAGIESIDLNYQAIFKTDENGNVYRYRGKIDDTEHKQVKSCYDVFLVNSGH
jgi:hypothetical protein